MERQASVSTLSVCAGTGSRATPKPAELGFSGSRIDLRSPMDFFPERDCSITTVCRHPTAKHYAPWHFMVRGTSWFVALCIALEHRCFRYKIGSGSRALGLGSTVPNHGIKEPGLTCSPAQWTQQQWRVAARLLSHPVSDSSTVATSNRRVRIASPRKRSGCVKLYQLNFTGHGTQFVHRATLKLTNTLLRNTQTVSK